MGMLAFPVNLVGMNDVFNPFTKEYVPFIVEGAKFQIPSQVNIQGQGWVAVNIGYVQLPSTLPTEYQIEVLDTNGFTILETLTLQEQIVGNEITIAKNQCIWFNENGLRGNYYIHSDWLGKILHIKRGFYIGTAVSSIRLGASNIYPWVKQYAKPDGTFDDNEAPNNWYKKMYGIDTTWELMFSGDSVAFITEGSYSNDGRSNGIQEDAIRNITGSNQSFARIYGTSSGCIYVSYTGGSGLTGGGLQESNKIHIDASRIVPTASVNRMRNRLIRVYHLLSINGVNVSNIIGE